MSSHDREGVTNFRSNYYHKLGSTVSTSIIVEEKKQLRKLLSMVPLDRRKLEQFCQHLHVPNESRVEIWKVLLKVSPLYPSTNEYVANQRQEHFDELHRVAQTMLIASQSDDGDILKYVIMYLIEERAYTLDIGQAIQIPQGQLFKDIIQVMDRMDLNNSDLYWISRNFTALVRQKVHHEITHLVDTTYQAIQKEDVNGDLFNHLIKVGALDRIPYSQWFHNCFASLLPSYTFIRVWDKVIAGSTVVLVYVAVALILINRSTILRLNSWQDVLKVFDSVELDVADEVARRGIELWHRNGGKLTPSSTRTSPAVTTDRSPTPTLSHFTT